VSEVVERTEQLIDGRWVESHNPDRLEVTNSTTEEVIARVPAGAVEDSEAAVDAARRAFDEWAATPRQERGKYLVRIADAMRPHAEEIARHVSAEVGTPLGMARIVHAEMPIDKLASYAEVAERFEWEEQIGATKVIKAPVGVVGAITPWNYPLNQIVQKVAPALVAGCTVVLKPSEVAPLSAYALADAFVEVGLPPGVFNMVCGLGPVVGEVLARHPEVDMVSFTGSTRAGKRISELAAQTVKRVALEMGGKSANILLDDADMDVALPAGLRACYFNAGQTCAALTRMLVPRERHDEVVERLAAMADELAVGDPSEDVDLGPLVSATQFERVRSYIQQGIEEGATLVAGGPELPEGIETGYFVRPTIFANVDNSMTIAQEEIFGPVLSVIPYDTEDEAVAIANDTIYGLSGAVWSDDVDRAEAVARRLRTGMVRINEGGPAEGTPFGGFKQSGLGRESGRFGLEEFVEIQTVNRPVA
jgi:betaine-aldehyde dehydrogenase